MRRNSSPLKWRHYAPSGERATTDFDVCLWAREGKGLTEGEGAGLVSAHIDPVLNVMVREILTRMSAKQKRILLLNQVDGYTTKEIGKIVGWPAGTVGRVLASAKAKFKDMVLESEESGGERRLCCKK